MNRRFRWAIPMTAIRTLLAHGTLTQCSRINPKTFSLIRAGFGRTQLAGRSQAYADNPFALPHFLRECRHVSGG